MYTYYILSTSYIYIYLIITQLYPLLSNEKTETGRNTITFTSEKEWFLVVRVCGTPSYAQLLKLLTLILTNIQIEKGNVASDYEKYIENRTEIFLDKTLTIGETIKIDGIETHESDTYTVSIISDDEPTKIDVEYYQDINKVIADLKNAILAQGGNV